MEDDRAAKLKDTSNRIFSEDLLWQRGSGMHFKNTTGCSQLSVIAVGKNCSYYQKSLSPNEKLIRAYIRPASIPNGIKADAR